MRRVIIKYQNYNEDVPRFTDRSIRKLIKIFDIDEYVLQDDLSQLLKKIDATEASVGVFTNDPEAATSKMGSCIIGTTYSSSDTSFVSGTWPLRAVPVCCSNAPAREEDLVGEDSSSGACDSGDCGQVPSSSCAPTSPELCSCDYSQTNPYFSPILVSHVLGWNPQTVDDVVSSSLVEDFLVVPEAYCPFSSYCCVSDVEGDLMELLAATNLVLE